MTEVKEKQKKPYYVDNKKFLIAMKEHKAKVRENEAKGIPPPQISDYIGDCILRISNKLSTSGRFINYSFRQEMIEDAIENCILYFHNFDPDRYSNPFAYFTQIAKNAFKRRIQKEEKERYTKYKIFQEKILHTELYDDLTDDDGDHLINKTMYDNINEFMAKYEAKEEKRKLRRKELKNMQKFILEENNEGESEPSGTNRIPIRKSAKSKELGSSPQ